MAGADYFLRAVDLYDRKEARNVDLAYRESRDQVNDARNVANDARIQESHDANMAQVNARNEQADLIAGLFDPNKEGTTLIEQEDGSVSVNTTDANGVTLPNTTSDGKTPVTIPKHMAESSEKIAMAMDPSELQAFVTDNAGGLTLNQTTGQMEFHDGATPEGQIAKATSAGLEQNPENGAWMYPEGTATPDQLRIQSMLGSFIEQGGTAEDALVRFDEWANSPEGGGETGQTRELRNTLATLVDANRQIETPVEEQAPSIADWEGAPDIGVNSYAAPTPGSQMTVSPEEARNRARNEDGYMPGRSRDTVDTFTTNPGVTTTSGPTDAEGNPLPGRSTSTTTGRTEGASTTVTAEDTARLEQLNRDARSETTADSKPKATVTKADASTPESLEEVAKSDITVTAKDEERIAETTAQNGRATYPEAQRRKIAALGIKAGNMNPQQAMNFIETGDMNKSTADVEAAGFTNAKAHNDFLKSELQLTELSQKIAANQDKQGAEAQKDRIAMHKNLVGMANSLLTTRDEKTGKMTNKNPAQAEKAANGFIAAGERAGWDMDTVLGTTNGIEAFQNYTNAFKYFDGQPGATDVAFRASSKGMVPANREVATLTNEVYQKLASSGVEDVVGLQDQILGMTAGKSAEDQERILKNALASLPSAQ